MNWLRIADKGLRLFITVLCGIFTAASGALLVVSLLHGMAQTYPRGVGIAAAFFFCFGWCTRLMWNSVWED